MIDPTLRTQFASGVLSSRGRFTIPVPKRVSFTYNFLTRADKILLENYEDDVNVGAGSFDFRDPITGDDWEMRFLSPIVIGVEPRLIDTYFAQINLIGKKTEKMRTETYWTEDLAAGSDIANRPIFVNPKAVTIESIGILTQGAPAGIDDSNTVVIEIKDDAGNILVSKTYDTGTQPPTDDYEDLGNLNNASLAAAEHLELNVTQGTTANLPIVAIVIEYYYT